MEHEELWDAIYDLIGKAREHERLVKQLEKEIADLKLDMQTKERMTQ